MAKHLPVAITLALALLPAPAAADSRITLSGGVLTFFSEDVGVANRLLVEDAAARLRFFDPADPFGMRFAGAPCDPGRLNDRANVIEIFCDPRALRRVDIDVGDGEDIVDYTAVSRPASIYGQLGADRVRTGSAADRVSGGQGDDTISTGAGDDLARGGDGADSITTGDGGDRAVGGSGADHMDTGAGDDSVQTADGDADTVDCGPGHDIILADTVDQLAGCEAVTREDVPAAAPPPPEDDVRPTLRVRARSRQRLVVRRPRIRIAVTSSEQALVRASGYLAVGGINSRLAIASAALDGPADQRELIVRLSPAQGRRVLRDLRRGRRPRVRLAVSAVDGAGNTSAVRRLTIRLSR